MDSICHEELRLSSEIDESIAWFNRQFDSGAVMYGGADQILPVKQMSWPMVRIDTSTEDCNWINQADFVAIMTAHRKISSVESFDLLSLHPTPICDEEKKYVWANVPDWSSFNSMQKELQYQYLIWDWVLYDNARTWLCLVTEHASYLAAEKAAFDSFVCEFGGAQGLLDRMDRENKGASQTGWLEQYQLIRDHFSYFYPEAANE